MSKKDVLNILYDCTLIMIYVLDNDGLVANYRKLCLLMLALAKQLGIKLNGLLIADGAEVPLVNIFTDWLWAEGMIVRHKGEIKLTSRGLARVKKLISARYANIYRQSLELVNILKNNDDKLYEIAGA